MRRIFWTSSLGKKYLVAATGLALFGFVVAHLVGNLQVFLGPQAINDYAEHLASLPALLWPARLALLAALIIHVFLAIQLSLENRRARPTRYAEQKSVASTAASRTMLVTGAAVFFFIVYHLLHFTFGAVHSEYYGLYDARGRHDVYSMTVASFRNPWIAGSYILAMVFLCLHLSHGIGSMFQSLGLSDEKLKSFWAKAARVAALFIFMGNSAIVAASFFGFLKLAGKTV